MGSCFVERLKLAAKSDSSSPRLVIWPLLTLFVTGKNKYIQKKKKKILILDQRYSDRFFPCFIRTHVRNTSKQKLGSGVTKSRYCLPRHWSGSNSGLRCGAAMWRLWRRAKAVKERENERFVVRLCSPRNPLLLGNASCESRKRKKKRKESVRACCTGGLSVIPAPLLRNWSLCYERFTAWFSEVCTPTGRMRPAVATALTHAGGRLHPAVTCLPTQRAGDPILLFHHPGRPGSSSLASGTKGPLAGWRVVECPDQHGPVIHPKTTLGRPACSFQFFMLHLFALARAFGAPCLCPSSFWEDTAEPKRNGWNCTCLIAQSASDMSTPVALTVILISFLLWGRIKAAFCMLWFEFCSTSLACL